MRNERITAMHEKKGKYVQENKKKAFQFSSC